MPEGVELAVAYVSIVPEGSKIAPEVRKQFGAAGVEAGKAGKSAGKRFGSAFGGGLKLLGGAAIGGGIISFLKSSNDEARESQKVGALTNNVIKQTKGVANISAAAVGKLSTAISNKTGIDDEAIQSGANLLLTFKNIRNEAGAGSKIFNRATQAATDLSKAGFGDLAGASKQLGKALNDPVKGISALGRAGVTFTDQQKDQIKTFVKSGDILKAQKIILKEVESQVGGAAAAQATAGDKLKVAYDNLKEQVGTALLPTIDKLAGKLQKDFVPAISDFISGMQDGTGAGGEFADAVKNDILPVAKNLAGEAKVLFGALKPVLGILKELPPGLVASGAAAGLLGSKLGSLRTPLAANASGFEKLGRAGASLAGGAGLLAVADASTQTNRALGTLEGAAGGAAIGLSVGGPLGAAVGGIGGALLGLFTSGNEAADGIDAAAVAAEQAVPKIDSYASSLSGLSAVQTKATRAIAAENFQKNKALFDGTGLNPRLIISGLLGQKKALQQINVVLDKNYNIAAKNQQNLLGQLSTTQKNLAILKGDPAFKNQYDILLKQEAAQKRALDDAVKLTNTLGDRRAKQNKLLDGLGEEANRTRELRAQALSYKDLLNLGIAPAVARAFNGKTSVGPYSADVANLIDKFHIIDRTKWNPIIRAAGLKPGKDTTAAILRDLQNIARDRTARVNVQLTGDVAMAAALGAFGGGTKTLRVPVQKAGKGHFAGGPVRKGVAYPVGERRPELFIPNQNGRIAPSIGSGAVGSTPISLAGQRISVTIDGQTFRAYMETVADSRVDSAAAMLGETDRAL